MPTCKLISERPQVVFDENGRRILSRELVVDLGEIVYPLELWAADLKLDAFLRDDWRVKRGETGLSTWVRVQPGFWYDGASLPWWSIPLMGEQENYEVAGAVHDQLYRAQAPRELSDSIFWMIARSGSKHVTPTRAWLGWFALRLGGGRAYRSYRS